MRYRPEWESKPDWKIICEPDRKMGFGEYFPWQKEDEAIDKVIRPLDLNCEELMKHPNGLTIGVPAFLYKEKGLFAGIKRRIMKTFFFGEYLVGCFKGIAGRQ